MTGKTKELIDHQARISALEHSVDLLFSLMHALITEQNRHSGAPSSARTGKEEESKHEKRCSKGIQTVDESCRNERLKRKRKN